MKTKSHKNEVSRGSAPDKTPSKSKTEKRSGGHAESASRKPRSKTSSSPAAGGFPIVGVGASAGGLEAFTELLQNLPTDTGMAFVLVQHLDPTHISALTQLLSKATSLPVCEVTHDLPVEANHVYVIPPNSSMSIAKRVLKLQPRQESGGGQRSIDFFFESLAQDQRERAVGVILSGTASDGTLGLEAIKAEGGITFAQDESARYDSMPRNAVAAGCVDFAGHRCGTAYQLREERRGAAAGVVSRKQNFSIRATLRSSKAGKRGSKATGLHKPNARPRPSSWPRSGTGPAVAPASKRPSAKPRGAVGRWCPAAASPRPRALCSARQADQLEAVPVLQS